MSPIKKNAHVWAKQENHWYVEELRASAALFKFENFTGPIWDPACGGGNICVSAELAGYDAIGTDIVCRGIQDAPFWRGESDFLGREPFPRQSLDIVTNPPFFRGKGTEAFIRHALGLAKGKVAIFCDIKFLASAKRAKGLFKHTPPSRILIITPRVSCPPGEHIEAGGVVGGGTADWVWLVWDERKKRHLSRKAPEVYWLTEDE